MSGYAAWYYQLTIEGKSVVASRLPHSRNDVRGKRGSFGYNYHVFIITNLAHHDTRLVSTSSLTTRPGHFKPNPGLMFLTSHAVCAFRSSTTLSIASTRLASLGNQLGLRAISIRNMSSLPKTMKAVVIEKTGGTDVLQYKTDVPVPEPKGDEVLIKNEYIGINYIDT